jgi:hypothetical protein
MPLPYSAVRFENGSTFLITLDIIGPRHYMRVYSVGVRSLRLFLTESGNADGSKSGHHQSISSLVSYGYVLSYIL